ncbi:interferon alpha/beta receptor 1 [Gracilinanus agilis]|uniref:interferon alpha/beta receptor 1 n=1 Tax=Gracilinanus agilis TaxID=191870 RepID=UPI001CFD4C3C|nr:interferon alpha/beta receptor 1 [Gracilinanus agilis]
MSNWVELIGCHKVTGTKCDFTSTNLNVFEKIRVRIRSEKGQETSPWHNITPFVPFQIAQIGPPEVQLEAEDKSIIINISPPGTINSSMWVTDIQRFTYSLVIWKNSSNIEKTRLTVYSRDKINDLTPETTYCLKVQARLPRKNGSYSPVFCITTTAEHKLPRPENVEVDAVNNNYVLKWNYPYENMNFKVQYLPGFYKRTPTDYSDKWKIISGCKNITSKHCDFSKDITTDGIYYLRVQASNGSITSFWSTEKKFDTLIKTSIAPPSIKVISSADSFSVYISASEESEKKLSQNYPLIYEVTYWENNSNIENKMRVKQKLLKVSDLQPLTTYCFKAKAFLQDNKSNKSSQFSNVQCSKMIPGKLAVSWIIVICIVFLMVLVLVFYCSKVLLKQVKHMFYPSWKTPSSMSERFSDQPLKNLLVASEEQTESCIIEETNIVMLEEIDQNGKSDIICSKQENQDSGNFSNEDETSSSKVTEEKLQLETMQ